MRSVGDESWRLTVDDKSDLLHTALYVRDSCRLDVPDDPSVPQPLDGDVSDHSAVHGPGVRLVAGAQWLSWWRRILFFEAAEALGTLELPEGPFGRSDANAIVRGHLFDWPELEALASWPELGRAAQASRDDAVLWCGERSRRLATRDPRSRGLSHLPIATIVQGVVQRAGVSPGRVRAAVSILGVRGDWSAVPVPGLLLCSASLAADAQKLAPLVEFAFVSGVDAQEVALPAQERKRRPLPPSVIPEPLVLWERAGTSLTCERVIPYHDGFEIEIGRHGLGPPTTPGSTAAPRRRPHRQFAGLQVNLRYADGREELLDDVERDDREGPITVVTFGRRGSGDDTLWLWVMPLPPPGEVQLTVEWPNFGIEPVSVWFDGATIRPGEAA
jgi:hypothetical protein